MTILDGQTVVVNSASAGLGCRSAQVPASERTKVALVARRADALEGVD